MHVHSYKMDAIFINCKNFYFEKINGTQIQRKRGSPYGQYLSIIIFCFLFQDFLRSYKLISIDLDEIKKKLARIYVVFNFKNYKAL